MMAETEFQEAARLIINRLRRLSPEDRAKVIRLMQDYFSE